MLWLRRQRLENQQRVDELIERVDQHAAGLARQRDPRAIVSRQGTGVRSGGGETVTRAAALQYDHGFAALAARSMSKSRRAVFAPFRYKADHPGLLVGEIELEQIRWRDVGAIADGDQAGKLDAA